MPFRSTCLVVFLVFFAPVWAFAGRFTERELLSGAEQVVRYGMDTTDNWWAITQPFTAKYRLTVNSVSTTAYDTVAAPVFSPDGTFWAALAVKQQQWHIITADGELPLVYNHAEELQFSADSYSLSLVGYRGDEAMLVSYAIVDDDTTEQRKLQLRGKPLLLLKKTGPYFLNPTGNRRAYVGMRSGSKVVNVEGKESLTFDDIVPVGFWYDGGFLYGGKLGGQWKLYKDNEDLTGSFSGFSEAMVNTLGTVVAFIGSYESGSVVVVVSDEYYEPVIGERFDVVKNLVLHPTARLYAYNAMDNGVPFVVFNSAKYSTTLTSSRPQFSWNGKYLVFIACDIECSLNIDGKQYPLYSEYDVNYPIVAVPSTSTFAYISSTSLAVRKYTSKEVSTGMIVDEMSAPRYNSRIHAYEMLGRINQRLYMVRYEL